MFFFAGCFFLNIIFIYFFPQLLLLTFVGDSGCWFGWVVHCLRGYRGEPGVLGNSFAAWGSRQELLAGFRSLLASCSLRFLPWSLSFVCIYVQDMSTKYFCVDQQLANLLTCLYLMPDKQSIVLYEFIVQSYYFYYCFTFEFNLITCE